MKKIKQLIFKLKHLINSIYYLKASIAKNAYPCKLIGEKIKPFENKTIVTYKVLGMQDACEIHLEQLFSNKNIIDKFHPLEAAKLGALALEEIILELSDLEAETKFNQIKNIMLNSTHDIYPATIAEKTTQNIEDSEKNKHDNYGSEYLELVKIKNIYPYKLVGGKKQAKEAGTIILFTILGKRDGYQKQLTEIICEKNILEKFHPTEAAKFGFIHLGDILFSLPYSERIEQITQIKRKIVAI